MSRVTVEIENASHAKRLLSQKLMSQSGHRIVVTEVEQFNNPDILSVTRSGKLIEYEIKLSKADLMGELNSVKECKKKLLRQTMNQGMQYMQMEIGGKTANASLRGNIFVDEEVEAEKIGPCSKLDKHDLYLVQNPSKHDYYNNHRPNQFYFAVTADLVPIAMEVCEGIPYGVLNLNDIYGSTSIKARAGWIHREEVSKNQLHRMATSLSAAYWYGSKSLEQES